MDFAANITSFLSYSLPNSVLTGGDANTSFSLLNLASNTLVMGGRFTSGQVLDSLAALANYQAASSGTGIPLPKCHSALTSSGVFLVLGGSQPVRMTCSYMSTRTHVLFSLSLSLSMPGHLSAAVRCAQQRLEQGWHRSLVRRSDRVSTSCQVCLQAE